MVRQRSPSPHSPVRHPGGNPRGWTSGGYGGAISPRSPTSPHGHGGGNYAGSPTRQRSLMPQDEIYGHGATGEKLHQALMNYDVCAFRHELTNRQQTPYADPNERNEGGRTCLDQCLGMIEYLVTRSICTSHIVEKEEGSRIGATIKQLKALISIAKMLVQDPRTMAPTEMFLANFPPPYFLLAVIKTTCEDYKDPITGESRDSSDVLAMNALVAEILSNPNARHYKHIYFLSHFPKCIRTTIELIGRERFAPEPVAAQRFMHMSFIFNESELFKCAAMTANLYTVGNLCNWDEVLSVLQDHPDKFRDFFFALLSSKLRGSIREEFAKDLSTRTDFNIPNMHVSHRLLEASRDVFGEEVALSAVRLRQRYLRPVPPRTGAAWKHHTALAEELSEMSWKDVCTAIRSIS